MRLSTGVRGLDGVLDGGLPAGRAHLVRGGPGSGKTTLALHFLCRGAEEGEPTLYVSLTSPQEDIHDDATSVGMDTRALTFLDLSAPLGLPEDAEPEIDQHLYREDQERTPIVRAILGRARALEPRRVVVDSLTRLRELVPDVHEFRREVLALIRAVGAFDATILATSETTERTRDDELQFLADGVVTLDADSTAHRTVHVSKLRGSGFHRGDHTVLITDEGLVVHPRLSPGRHRQPFSDERLSFGVPELNQLLHGGLERGTMTLISGPSGAGKSTVGAQFMKEAAGRGERSALFMFDEAPETFVHRCEAVDIPIRAMLERGTLSLIPVEPLAHSPDEIAAMVRTEVEDHSASVVMIDSVPSYQLSMPDRSATTSWTQLHALGRYMKNMGVTGILIDETPNVTGDFFVSQYGLSYLADTVLFLRYLEIQGELTKAIGVLKKRTSGFEQALRRLRITPNGLQVGAPLSDLRGLLSGIPEFVSPAGAQRGEGSGAHSS